MAIRILQVVTSMDVGGIETLLMNIYRNIDRSKVQFDFLVHRKATGFFDEEIKLLGGRIFYISPLKLHYVLRYYKQLKKILNENNEFNIIHSHINSYSCLPLFIARLQSLPIRIAHSHTYHESFKSIPPLRLPIILFCNYFLKKQITHAFACSDLAGKWLFGDNMQFKLIKNAIDVSKFSYNPEVDKQTKNNFDIGGKYIIGHIGNFSKAKNYPFLLEVFKVVQNKNDKVCLMLIGNNKNNLEVEKRVIEMGLKESVIFTGVRSDIAELLQGIDVFLFPSHHEGLPVTLVEAQAAGLKIFASDGITREVALTSDIEFLSLDKPVEYWAEQILQSLPYKRNNNSAIIKNKGYDIVNSAKQLQKFYLKQIRTKN